ncbi:hypothetical protein BVX98_06440 [bacterium F11]|nr:hypothetical protein BVX98_06440 [bacterium F11]
MKLFSYLRHPLKCLLLITTTLLINGPLYSFELTLKKAIELTFQTHPDILRMLSDYRTLQAQTRLNLGLYDWVVDLGFDYSDVDQAPVVIFQPTNTRKTTYNLNAGKSLATGTTFGLSTSVLKTEDNSSFNLFSKRYETQLGLTLQQNLLDGFLGQPDRVKLKTDQSRLKSLQLMLWRELEMLASAISQRYWNLWRDVQLYAVARESEDEAKDFMDETVRLSKIGLREEDDILQAEASWLRRREETLTAKTLLDNAWSSLKISIGLHKDTDWDSLPSLEDPDWNNQVDYEKTLKMAYINRADLQSSAISRELNKELKDSQNSKIWPQLTASGGYSLVGLDPKLKTSIKQVRKYKNEGWNLGMSLSHSFGQNMDRSEMELAEAEYLRSQSQYRKRINAVEEEVEVGVNEFKRQLQILDLSKEIENRRMRIKNIFQKKFKNGRISIQDLLRAQEESRQSRYRRHLAESQMAITQLKVDLAQGSYLSQLGFGERYSLPIIEKTHYETE